MRNGRIQSGVKGFKCVRMENCHCAGKLQACARITAAVAAMLFLLRTEAGTTAPSITLRPAFGRVWQTCLKPSEPIQWPWIDGATSARLTVASLCTGKTNVYAVAKVGSEVYGSQALPPNRRPGSERLFDLKLEYLNGEDVLATETARVAVLPGVDGGAFDLRSPTGSDWTRSPCRHPLIAYDADWDTNDVSVVSLQQSVGGAAATVRALDGTSGYDVADTSKDSLTLLTLLHDGVAAFTGACRYAAQGLVLVFR